MRGHELLATQPEPARGGHMTQNTSASARIVVGVDPSDNAAKAAAWAADEAVGRGLELHLVHATDLPDIANATIEPPDYAARQNKAGTDLLQSVAASLREHFAELAVSTEISEFSPAKTLVALSSDAELVVTGTRGHGGFVGMLLGSVSLKLAAHAHSPIVVVHGDNAAPAREEVVLGIERGEAEAPIRYAFETAARHGAALHAVHAWFPDTGYGKFPPIPTPGDQRESELAGTADTIAAIRAEFPDVPVSVDAVVGNAVPTLIDAARGARLLVVGAHRTHGPLSVGAGYVVRGLLAHSQTPVAVVPIG
jgi:nucleotide-binding universal stress UspA family protein